MYRIKFVLNTFNYELHSSEKGAFEGDLNSITNKAIEIGMRPDELTVAYQTMAKNKHTVAEFGMNGTFMYSHKKV